MNKKLSIISLIMVFVMLSLFAEGCTCEQGGMTREQREQLVSHSEEACIQLNESLDVLLQNIQVEGPEAEASRQAWQEVEAYTAELQRLIQQAQHAGIKVELVAAEHSPLGVILVIGGTIIAIKSLFLSYSYTQALTEALEAEGCQLEPWQKMVIFDIHAGVIAAAQLMIGKAALRQFMTSVAQYGLLMGLPYAVGTAHLTSKVGEILLELMLEHAVGFEKNLILSIIDCLGAEPTQEAAPATSLVLEDFKPTVLPAEMHEKWTVVVEREDMLPSDRAISGYIRFMKVSYGTTKPGTYWTKEPGIVLLVSQFETPEQAESVYQWFEGRWGFTKDNFVVTLSVSDKALVEEADEMLEQIKKQVKY